MRALRENGAESKGELCSRCSAVGYVGDSQISCRVIHGQSALRRADPCSALDFVTTSGSRSRTFCLAGKAMWVALQRTIGCSSTQFFTDTEREFPGVICQHVSATGRFVHQRFSRWAKSGVFERIFRLLASDSDNEYMMIDATIVRAHQHSAGARKKTARKRSAARAVD